MSLHSVFIACCCRLTPPASRRGQPMSSLAEYALRTHSAPTSLFLGMCGLCCRFVFDDVSKVTLPAWPGQGLDAIVYL